VTLTLSARFHLAEIESLAVSIVARRVEPQVEIEAVMESCKRQFALPVGAGLVEGIQESASPATRLSGQPEPLFCF